MKKFILMGPPKEGPFTYVTPDEKQRAYLQDGGWIDYLEFELADIIFPDEDKMKYGAQLVLEGYLAGWEDRKRKKLGKRLPHLSVTPVNK